VKRFLTILLLFVIVFSNAHAQSSTNKLLATQYYQNQEYDKAVILYADLFNKSQLHFYYSYYLNCLLKLEDFKKAEKLVKKQVKKNQDNLQYEVDLGYVYKSSGDDTKAKLQFEKAIKKLRSDRSQVITLANSFINRGEEEYAIQSYLRGRKMLKGRHSFHIELANAYSRAGRPLDMISEYLDLLHKDVAYKNQVQNILQYKIFEDPGSKRSAMLHRQLIKRIQKHPDKVIYSEMLIWLHVQKKDFESAFTYAKAIDKRFKEDGKRIMNLGRLSADNDYYDVAIMCFEYNITKGKSSVYYIQSKMKLLDVINKKITRSSYTENDLQQLEKNYISTIEELGKTSSTVSLLRGLARLQAFYLNNTPGAIELLEETITMPRAKAKDLAWCKLELADILLLTGEVWDASLYYSQVEKAFKHDPIGHEAKFRNAKLYYYVGQFDWAHAQLDVLKASTSKLIANDAMDLALLISDNTVLDTSTTALLMFAKAEMYAFQNKSDSAIGILDSILQLFPAHSLTDEIYYEKADLMMKNRNYEEARKYFQIIVSDYSFDILGDDALFDLAALYQFQFEDKEKAMELYQELLTTFPGSLFTVEARKRFRSLRGDKLN